MKAFAIQIKSREEAHKEFTQAWRAVAAGKKVTPSEGVYFTSLEAVRRLITDKRMLLLHLIREKNPKSIYELAKLAHRDFKNVHADVKLLEWYGLIELDPPSKKKKTTRRGLRSPYDAIDIHAVI